MTKTWLITGAARGLGRNITEAALAAGDTVVATARDPAASPISRPDTPIRCSPSRSTSPTWRLRTSP